MEKLILIKYGELTTKKGNRKTFIKLLENNIKKTLQNIDYTIIKDLSRMYIETKDFDSVINKLKKIFGLHGIIVCYKAENNIDNMASIIIEDLKQQSFKTFKIETHRPNKKFPMESMEVSKLLGAHVLKNINCKVDVHNPDIKVNVEIRDNSTYIYTKEIRGIGGYPVGIQGKGLLMLSGGIDSPVAGYLSLKRGVDLECIYFESPPHTSLEAKNKVIKLASIINEYSGNIKVHIVPFTKIQETIYKNVPANYNITIMRRMMYRIATKLAYKRNCHILINGESIGQVASQTLNSMVVINNVTNIPVIRPVACFDKLEIIDIAKKIGTYETSILPYEDCCTLFVPKHPVINPILKQCETYEENFDYNTLIEDSIKNIETIKDLNFSKYQDYL